MKKYVLMMLGAAALVVQGPAFASIISTVNKNLYMTAGQSTFTTHNVPDLHYVGADLTIVLADDNKCNVILCADEWLGETAYTIGLGHLGLAIDASTSHTFEIGGLGLLELNLLNSYTYQLKALVGDFWFVKSVLELEAKAVPEPSVLFLLGGGLLGIAFLRRRQRSI